MKIEMEQVLCRFYDGEFIIKTMEEAIEYFWIDKEEIDREDMNEIEYNDYVDFCDDFNRDLTSCDDLQEVADLLNSVTDTLFDGREYYTKIY